MYTLVPVDFFNPSDVRGALAEVAQIREGARIAHARVPQYGAVLIYEVSGEGDPLPEIFRILADLPSCKDYNKVLCSWKNGALDLAIAQGKSLLLANNYRAADFTTALYFILLALKSLQLNPEVTTICFRHPLTQEQEMAVCRYFKAAQTP